MGPAMTAAAALLLSQRRAESLHARAIVMKRGGVPAHPHEPPLLHYCLAVEQLEQQRCSRVLAAIPASNDPTLAPEPIPA